MSHNPYTCIWQYVEGEGVCRDHSVKCVSWAICHKVWPCKGKGSTSNLYGRHVPLGLTKAPHVMDQRPTAHREPPATATDHYFKSHKFQKLSQTANRSQGLALLAINM